MDPFTYILLVAFSASVYYAFVCHIIPYYENFRLNR